MDKREIFELTDRGEHKNMNWTRALGWFYSNKKKNWFIRCESIDSPALSDSWYKFGLRFKRSKYELHDL